MSDSGPSATTAIGGVLAIILSAIWALLALLGVLLGLALLIMDEDDATFLGFEDLFDFVGGILAAVSLVVLVIAVWSIVVGVKVVQGSGWARVAGILTFGIFALISLAVAVGDRDVGQSSETSVSQDDGGDRATGIANLVASGAVVVLLALPGGKRDG